MMHRGFRDIVRCLWLGPVACDTRHGAEIDNRALAHGNHVAAKGTRAPENPVHIDIHHTKPVGVLQVFGRDAALPDPGVVDEDCRGLTRIGKLTGDIFHPAGDGDVTDPHFDIIAFVAELNRVLGVGLASFNDDDGSSRFRQRLNAAKSDGPARRQLPQLAHPQDETFPSRPSVGLRCQRNLVGSRYREWSRCEASSA